MEVAEKEGHPMDERKVLIDVGQWAAPHDTYCHIFFIMKTLELIALGLHRDYSDKSTTGWEGK